jgi:hypothetical protein
VLLFVDFFHFFLSYFKCKSLFLCGLVGIAENLTGELEIKFPTQSVINAFGIVYPQYWLQLNYDVAFANHLQVFKVTFCYGKIVCKVNEQEVQVQGLLHATNFDSSKACSSSQ